ncbi:MAG: ABC transporter permease [Acidobacteria bacterium]|nr:ABC transporter permease [Acidobacteriota bacterium]
MSEESLSLGAGATSVRVVSARVGLPTRLANLWRRRELLRNLISSDVQIKYKGSALGLLWSMLAPAFTLGIYYLVFSVFLKNGYPNYVIFLFSGLIVWNLFQNAVNVSTSIIVDRAGLVKKVSFPREILPLASVGAAVVFWLIQMVVLVLFLVIFHHAPDWGMLLLLPVTFAALYLFTAAVAIVMSALTVYLRDIKHLMEVLLQLWFWLSPVVYSYSNSIAPALHRHGLAAIYFINPMSLIVLTFQRTFYNATTVTSTLSGQPLHMLPTWSVGTFVALNVGLLIVAAVVFLLALVVFGRLEGNFESEL